jgi:hypothetical protein
MPSVEGAALDKLDGSSNINLTAGKVIVGAMKDFR